MASMAPGNLLVSPWLASTMRRTSTMTLGFVLIFIGAQLALVDSYRLTPRMSNFLSERGGSIETVNPMATADQGRFNPFTQAAFSGANQPSAGVAVGNVPQKEFSPPAWLCWPVLFLGTVILLHGFSMSRR